MMRIVALIFALAIGFAGSSAAATQCPSSPIVQLLVTKSDPSRPERGSGFVIRSDRGFIATAFHVIDGARRIDVIDHSGVRSDVVVIAVRPDEDLAIIAAGAFAQELKTHTSAPAADARLTIEGFPFAATDCHSHRFPAVATRSGFMKSSEWSDSLGPIFRSPVAQLIALETSAEEGLSGAPVLNEAGNVVGIFLGSLRQGGGQAWAAASHYLLSWDGWTLLEVAPDSVSWQWPAAILASRNHERAYVEAGPWASCRAAAAAYKNALESSLEAQRIASQARTLREPYLDEARRMLSTHSGAEVLEYIRLVSKIVPLGVTSEELSKSVSDLLSSATKMQTRCFSPEMRLLLDDPDCGQPCDDVRAKAESILREDAKFMRQTEAVQVEISAILANAVGMNDGEKAAAFLKVQTLGVTAGEWVAPGGLQERIGWGMYQNALDMAAIGDLLASR
ncbi:MAG: serine protease [Pseudomonadota bacterium]